jgi:sec-independent protein translocase protein TatB
MFEVGFSELLVIFVLALVVLGPERLPRLAQQVGRWIGRARAMAKQFREQLEDEVNLADMKKWQDTSSQSTSGSSTSSTTQNDTASAQTDAAGQPEASQTSAASPDTEAAATTPENAFAAGTPEQSAASPGHYAGPPPEPEAAVYQPPAYGSAGAASSGNGSTPHSTSGEPAHAVESAAAATHSNSTASHDPAPASDERPARPGDVITHTHERGI